MKTVNQPGEAPTIMSRSSMWRGLAGFAALTVAGLGALFIFSLGDQVEDVATKLSGGFLALALSAALADYFICGLRHYVFLRRLAPGTRVWLPVRADLVGRFTGAVTPSQTGGGPGQIFVLYRGGIPLPTILSVLTLNLIATLVFFGIFGGAATWTLGDRVSSVAIGHLVRWGFLAVVAVIGFLSLAMTRPDLVARPLEALSRRLEGRAGRLANATRRGTVALIGSGERYKASCIRCFREWPALPVIAIALTLLLYLNRFTLGWLILRGLGFEGSYLLTLTVQAVLHLILYVAPTPGGSGIAEVSTGVLMSLLLPASALASFTLVYRFFLTYLPAAIGAFLLARELRPQREVARVATAAVAAGVVAALLLHATGPTAVAAEVGAPQDGVVVAPLRTLEASDPHERMAATILQAIEDGIMATSRDDSLAAFDIALHLSAELARVRPDDAEAHYLFSISLGKRLELAGTREKIQLGQRCREEAEMALLLDPDHAGAHHVLGRLHAGTMRLGRLTRFVARKLLGAKALEGASWEVAEYHFTRSSETDPSDARNWVEMAQLYIDNDRPDEAAEALRRTISAPSRWPSDHLVVERAVRALATLDCDRCEDRDGSF